MEADVRVYAQPEIKEGAWKMWHQALGRARYYVMEEVG